MTLSLQQFLPYRLYVLANRISQSLASHYEARFGITRAEWRVLAVLGEGIALSSVEITERTAMDKVAVSRAVNRLLECGQLTRRTCERDKRRAPLVLSTSGQTLYDSIVPVALAHEQRVLAHLSGEERTLLFKLLDRLDTEDFAILPGDAP